MASTCTKADTAAHPLILDVVSSEVLDVIRDTAGLLLNLVVNNEDRKLGGRGRGALFRSEKGEVLVDILLELRNGVGKGGA